MGKSTDNIRELPSGLSNVYNGIGNTIN